MTRQDRRSARLAATNAASAVVAVDIVERAGLAEAGDTERGRPDLSDVRQERESVGMPIEDGLGSGGAFRGHLSPCCRRLAGGKRGCLLT